MGNIGGIFITSAIVYAVPALVLWMFYRILSRINDNLAGIRQTLEDRPRA